MVREPEPPAQICIVHVGVHLDQRPVSLKQQQTVEVSEKMGIGLSALYTAAAPESASVFDPSNSY